MRECLMQFLKIFPRNTIFLSLYGWADSSLRVADETRAMLNDKILQPSFDCLSSRVFATEHELSRGGIHSTRAAFEGAITSDASRSSPGIWISYLEFCASQRELKSKAKGVLYRGLRQCPGSKVLMMKAFTVLSQEMESSELRSIFNTMTSKDLRVHVDLEEFLASRQDRTASRS